MQRVRQDGKKPRQSHSKIKVILMVFFDYRGVVHYEFLRRIEVLTSNEGDNDV